MVNIKRWFLHTFMPPWRWRLAFPATVLKDIEMAVKQSEHQHRGELRFAIEKCTCAFLGMAGHVSASACDRSVFNYGVGHRRKQRCVNLFAMTDREVHIIADRGIARRVPQPSGMR